MRVLHLAAGNAYGGIERVLVASARHRAEADLEPEYGLCFAGRLSEELVAAGVAVHDLGPVRASRPFSVWRARRRLARLLASRAIDVVLTHASWPHAMFGSVARREGVRLAHWVHGALGSGHWTERRAARVVPDVLLVNSRYTATTVARVFPQKAPFVVPCPVEFVAPTVERADTRARLGASSDAVVVLLAARLDRWKGHDVLLDALDRLQGVARWECWIAGGPQSAGEIPRMEALLARVAGSSDGTRVRLLGQRSDVPDLLAAADIVCQPNTEPESFGVGFVEAFAAGLPVVTSAIGGALEIVDASCGVLVPPGDVLAVAEALRALIASPERRRALGSAGPARARAVGDVGTNLRRLAEALR